MTTPTHFPARPRRSSGDRPSTALFSVDGIAGNDTLDGGSGTDTATADPGDMLRSVP